MGAASSQADGPARPSVHLAGPSQPPQEAGQGAVGLFIPLAPMP